MPSQLLPTPSDPREIANYVDTYAVAAIKNDPTTLDLGDIPAIVYQGKVFARDEADTTSVHDGITTVVDNSGRRFKTQEVGRPTSVLGFRDSNNPNPPTNPAIGDAYLIFNGARSVGDALFADHIESIAIATRWGWVYIDPMNLLGYSVWDESIQGKRTFNGRIWIRGFGNSSFSARTIDPAALVFPGGISVEQEVRTPTITNGTAWLINDSGSTNNDKVIYISGNSQIAIDPYEGMEVYDKNRNIVRRFNGSDWIDIPGETTQFFRSRRYSTGQHVITARGSDTAQVLETLPFQGNSTNQFSWDVFPTTTGDITSENFGFNAHWQARYNNNTSDRSFRVYLVLYSGDPAAPNQEISNLVRSQAITVTASSATRDGSDYLYNYNGRFTWEDFRRSDFRNTFTMNTASGHRPVLALVADNKTFVPISISAVRWGIRMKIEQQIG